MAQPGYTPCGGCGRLFKDDDEQEVFDFYNHDCDDADDHDQGYWDDFWEGELRISEIGQDAADYETWRESSQREW